MTPCWRAAAGWPAWWHKWCGWCPRRRTSTASCSGLTNRAICCCGWTWWIEKAIWWSRCWGGSGQAICAGPWLVTLARSKLPDALALEDAYPAPQQTLNWHLTWLPDGFKVLSQDRHQLVSTSLPVDYMMLSDGLVDLSVYVSRVDPKQAVRQQLIRQGLPRW